MKLGWGNASVGLRQFCLHSEEFTHGNDVGKVVFLQAILLQTNRDDTWKWVFPSKNKIFPGVSIRQSWPKDILNFSFGESNWLWAVAEETWDTLSALVSSIHLEPSLHCNSGSYGPGEIKLCLPSLIHSFSYFLFVYSWKCAGRN